MKIHLVEPINHFVMLNDNEWESGGWTLNEGHAQQLVGGEIYFHKKRSEPSFYGGTILGYKVSEEGEHPGKIVFRFLYSPSCRNVKTDVAGWKKEVKIVANHRSETQSHEGIVT